MENITQSDYPNNFGSPYCSYNNFTSCTDNFQFFFFESAMREFKKMTCIKTRWQIPNSMKTNSEQWDSLINKYVQDYNVLVSAELNQKCVDYMWNEF